LLSEANGIGSTQRCSPVAVSTVRIWLMPSRKRREYGLSAAIATVAPSGPQVGVPGSQAAGMSSRMAPGRHLDHEGRADVGLVGDPRAIG
jgi:hypothetical protein